MIGGFLRLDEPTRNLKNYVLETGISLQHISDKTGIPYNRIRASLSKNSENRDLRVGEFWMICNHLELDPEMFFPE